MTNKVTPLLAAREWATKHPNNVGTVYIVHSAPRGRGGRLGTQSRTSTFYVKAGKAAQSRRIHERPDQATTLHNGVCEVCGQMSLEPVLQWANAPDPRAGQLTSERPDFGKGYAYLDTGYIRSACPACIEQHHLEVGYKNGWYDKDTQIYHQQYLHPMAVYVPVMLAKLELCKTEIVTTWLAEGVE